jgi:hypothetical protein
VGWPAAAVPEGRDDDPERAAGVPSAPRTRGEEVTPVSDELAALDEHLRMALAKAGYPDAEVWGVDKEAPDGR